MTNLLRNVCLICIWALDPFTSYYHTPRISKLVWKNFNICLEEKWWSGPQSSLVVMSLIQREGSAKQKTSPICSTCSGEAKHSNRS